MTARRRFLAQLMAVAGLAVLPGLAPGQRRDEGRDQAAAAVREATGGRVLGVREAGSEYHVKVLLPGGRVRVVRVDAKSGQILE